MEEEIFVPRVTLIAELKGEGDESIVETFTFESFSDAWQWILNHDKDIIGLTNPTITPIIDIKETPTVERAERLVRYAHYIREEQIVPGEVPS